VTDRELHLASAVPIAFVAVALGYHPVVALPLVVGTLLPELDAVTERLHRSWLLHTFLVPATVYQVAQAVDVATPTLVTAINFVTAGMALHFLMDYVYPQTMSHQGAEWPVRPAGPASHWGLLWLGAAWAFQWFLYLSPEFLPWLVGS